MKKQLYVVVIAGLMLQARVLCLSPRDGLSGQSGEALTFEQMVRASCNMQACRNIIQAAKSAGESTACKKSLAQLSAALNNHINTCTKEFSSRLNEEEKAIVFDIIMHIKDMLNFVTVRVSKINDKSLDQEAKKQLEIELTRYTTEQIQQLAIKVMPFGLVVKDEQVVQEPVKQEDVEKKLDEALAFMNSFFDSILSKFKKD